MQVLSKSNQRAAKARTFDAGSSDEDFQPGQDDDLSIDPGKVLKSDGTLITNYWRDDHHANATLYNDLVYTVYAQDGRVSPIFKEDSAEEEASEEDMDKFIVSDGEESDAESESEYSSSSAARPKGKQHGSKSKKAKAKTKRKGRYRASESESEGKDREDDPLAYVKRKVRKKIGRKWFTGTVMGYRKKTQLFQILYEDEEEDDVDLEELKVMLVRKTRGADSEEEEEEDSADERERAREKAKKERERQRKKERKGPPRINVLEDLRKDGFDVPVSRSSSSGLRGRTEAGDEMEEVEGPVDQALVVKFWAKCDRCQKWRHLPSSMEDAVNAAEQWFCTMAPGITCDDPQDPTADSDTAIDEPNAESGGQRAEAQGSASGTSQSARNRRKILDSDDDADDDRGNTVRPHGDVSGFPADRKDEESDGDGFAIKKPHGAGGVRSEGSANGGSRRKIDGSGGGSGTRRKFVIDSDDDDDDETPQTRTRDSDDKSTKLRGEEKGKGKQSAESDSEEEVISLKRKRLSQGSKQSSLQDDDSEIEAFRPEMERRRVEIWWDREKTWYAGVVKKYDAAKSEILVLYDDGDKRWHAEDESKQGWIQWEGQKKSILSPRQNANRETEVSTPRSADYSFRDRNRKKQKLEHLGDEVGDAWKQKMRQRNMQALKDEDDYEVGVGKKSSRDAAISLVSDDDEDMDDWIVPDDDDEDGDYDQKWKKEAIMHDDYDDVRLSRKHKPSASKNGSPRKHASSAERDRHSSGKGGSKGDDRVKSQSKLQLKRDDVLLALDEGDAQKLKELLKKHPQKVRLQDGKRPILHVAVAAGRVDCVKELLHMGAPKDDRDDSSETQVTALLLALEKREPAIANYLLDKGADVFKADAEGTLPLHMAAAACSLPMVDRILKRMTELKRKENHVLRVDMNGQQALHYAAGEGNIDLMKALVGKYDADPECKDKDDMTPLMVLAQAGHDACITTYIRDCMANVRAADSDGMTSLHHAASSGQHKCIQALLEEGAPLDAALPPGTSLTAGATPLHLASAGGHVECVRVLVEYGASVDLRDDQGWTPLVYADFMRNRECVVALLQPHKTDVCANQLKMLGTLLQTDRGETKERVVKVIEYAATVPEFYEAINRLVQMDATVLNGSMSFLLRNASLLSFPSKKAYFDSQVAESFTSHWGGYYGSNECNLIVDRSDLARTLVLQLLRLEPSEARSRYLHVRFAGEEGMGTGPARELFDVAPHELLAPKEQMTSESPSAPLFRLTEHGRSYHPAPGLSKRPVFAPQNPGQAQPSAIDDDVLIVEDGYVNPVPVAAVDFHPAGSIQRHLVEQPAWVAPAAAGGRGQVIMASQGMLAMGRFVGLALRHGMLFNGRFSVAFLRMLIGAAVTLEHLEEVDPDLHRNLTWLLTTEDSTSMVESVFAVTECPHGESARQSSGSAQQEAPRMATGGMTGEQSRAKGTVLIDDSEAAGSCAAASGASHAGEASAGSDAKKVVKPGNPQTHKVRQVELVLGGAKRAVTEKNKAEYVDLYARYKLAKAEGLEEGIRSFRRGMADVVPSSCLDIFAAQELELLLCGMPAIKVEEWKASAIYSGNHRDGLPFGPDSPLALWFWQIVEALPQAECALLLKFSTGSAMVPSQGFEHLMGLSGEQRFTIALMPHGDERLPTASTCFNLLKLPDYSSKAILEERKLLLLMCVQTSAGPHACERTRACVFVSLRVACTAQTPSAG